ncbi:MAG: hypothetical protein ACKE51_06480 [Methylococcaceae bacterium]
MNEKFLMIPLYKLYYIDNINDFSGFTKEDLKCLKIEYDESVLIGIVRSVRWATQHPDYDFSSLLPDLKQSNDEIFKYLCDLDSSLKTVFNFESQIELAINSI